jgi:ligand-binding sensor domain-containing protein
VLRTYPGLETFLPLLTRDDDLEQWRVTAAAASPGRSEVWLGTYGNGVLRVDPTFNRAEEVPFGLVESGVGALAPAADGVWAGGLGRPGTRGALVFASSDLQRWRWLDGPRSRPFAGARVNAIAVRGQTAWIGTSRGLVRMDVEDDSRVSVWSATQGMPSDVVTSVVARADGAWVGTSAGLARVSETVRAVGPRVQVHGLAPWGDTLWIASSAGVSALVPGDSIPRTLALGDARLRRPIVAVARTDSVMIAVTAAAELIEIDVRAKRVLAPRAAAVSSLRTVAQVAVDAQTLWLAGEGGVLVIDRSTGRSTFLAAGSALPGPATAMIITREVAWVGTRDGLVRIRRRADGMPP